MDDGDPAAALQASLDAARQRAAALEGALAALNKPPPKTADGAEELDPVAAYANRIEEWRLNSEAGPILCTITEVGSYIFVGASRFLSLSLSARARLGAVLIDAAYEHAVEQAKQCSLAQRVPHFDSACVASQDDYTVVSPMSLATASMASQGQHPPMDADVAVGACPNSMWSSF